MAAGDWFILKAEPGPDRFILIHRERYESDPGWADRLHSGPHALEEADSLAGRLNRGLEWTHGVHAGEVSHHSPTSRRRRPGRLRLETARAVSFRGVASIGRAPG